MTDWSLLLTAFGYSTALFVIVAIVITIWRFSGVPLNRYRDAHCPDGVSDHITPSAFGLTWTKVGVVSDYGKLPAWFVAGGDTPVNTKWAILVHGRGGSLASCVEVLPAFHDAGYSTLTISYRGDEGTNPSPDGLDHLGDTEWRDLQNAVELAYLAGAREICLYGRSAGGQIIGQYLKQGTEYLPLIKSVILDDPALDWRAVFLNNRPGWLPKWVGRLILTVAGWRIRRPMSHFDLAANPPLYRPRMMILHGRNDEVVPFSSSQRFMDRMTNNWKLMLVQTTGMHGTSRHQNPASYDMFIKLWLDPESDIAQFEEID